LRFPFQIANIVWRGLYHRNNLPPFTFSIPYRESTMKSTLPILLLLAGLLSACNPPAQDAAPASGTTGKTETSAPTPQVDPVPPANARQSAPAPAATTAERLIGKWQSTDDKSNVLEFDGKNRIEGGQSASYTLGDRCTNEMNKDDGTPAESDRYISSASDDMCWYIIEVTPDKLSLSYMGRGNTLNYTRIR
jgi:hypothetical protein